MPGVTIGRIERVPLREVWAHEALDFTVWLEQNIDLLNDYLATPIDPESVRREAAAGAFAVDLVVEDVDGDTVIIENQLERSNHDHLGKIVTYVAALTARTAVWIVSEPRDEHVRAISWLNDAGPTDFWLFKVEAVRIENSPPAPFLTKIVGPSADVAVIRRTAEEGTARGRGRLAFFTELLEHAADRTNLHAGIAATTRPWLGRRVAGTYNWIYGVRTDGTRAMLYIDRGAGRRFENDAIYQTLLRHRGEIERSFGQPLSWEAKESNRSRTVFLDLSDGGWAAADNWPGAIEATVGAMIALERAISPFLPEAIAAGDAAATESSVDSEEDEEPLEVA